MTARITPAALSALSLVALALVLAVASGRAELFLVCVPLTLRLLGAARRPEPPGYALAHEISATRLFEGEELAVTVVLTAHMPLPQVEVLEPVPSTAVLVSGTPRIVQTVRAAETVRWRYVLRFVERGPARLGLLRLRVWDRSGARVVELRHHDPKMVQVYPRAMPPLRLPAPLRTQTSAGNYVSPAVGEGIEPGEIRPFAPGDRIRHVNWRATSRTGRLVVTRHHEERNADVVLMLDTLSAVGAAPASTLDVTLRAAASLAAAYLARKDRVGVIEYGGVLGWLRPGSGRPHFERLLETLIRAQVTFTYVAKSLDVVPPRVLPPQALVIALSPLLDDRFVVAVTDLARRGFDLVVLAVDPIGPTRAALGARPLVETACALWALEHRLRLDELAALGLRVAPWNDGEPLEICLARVGRYRRARALVG